MSAVRHSLHDPNDPLRLALGAREASGWYDPASKAHAEGLAQVGLETLGRVVTGDLHQHGHLIHLAHAPVRDHKLRDLRMPTDDVLDLGGIQVYAAHREHIVDAPANAADELQKRAATRAWLAGDLDSVAGPVAHQWHAPAAQVRGDQLTFGGGPAGAVQHLEDELGLDPMDAISLRAAESGRAKLGHAGVVEARSRVGRFDGGPSRGGA